MGAIDRADDYAVLRDEVEQELAHLGSLEEYCRTCILVLYGHLAHIYHQSALADLHRAS